MAPPKTLLCFLALVGGVACRSKKETGAPNGMPGGWEEIDDFTATDSSSTYEHAPVAPEILPANLNYRVRRYDG